MSKMGPERGAGGGDGSTTRRRSALARRQHPRPATEVTSKGVATVKRATAGSLQAGWMRRLVN